ncbi:MAG: FtsX-like permease family protein, partial [Actinomycetota bacterium]
DMRARWRAWLVIALMVAVASGVVMTAVAGGRRSDSAVARFLAHTHAPNASVEADPSTFHAIAQLPEVEHARAMAFMLMGEKRGVNSVSTESFSTSTLAFVDPQLVGRTMILVAGRMPDFSRPDEAVTNETAVRSGALRLGQRVSLLGYTFDQLEEVLRGSNAPPQGPSATVTVVGVIRTTTDLTTSNPPAGVVYTGSNVLLLTPALYRKVGEQTAHFAGIDVRLKHGKSSVASFTAGVAQVTNGEGVIHTGSDDVQAAAEAQRATHTEAIALWLFAGFAGLAALLVIGQTISRQILLAARDNQTLLALGMTRWRLVVLALLQVGAAAVTGAVLGIGVAIALSPLTPIGLSRVAEVDRGVHLDLPVIALGSIACVLVLLVRSAFPAWRAGRALGRDLSHRHPSRTAGALARGGMPASSVAGVQMALDPGYGQNSVPVRTAVAGSVVAVAVLIASLAFGASLTRLGKSPAAQGWTWDAAVGNPHSDDVSASAIPLLRDNPHVAAFSSLMRGNLLLDGRHEVAALGLDHVVGDVGPTILEGREPRAADEIALGTKVLKALHKDVGNRVRIQSVAEQMAAGRTLTIVGRVLIDPVIINGEITLGDGALMPQASFREFVPPGEEEGAVNVFPVRFEPGTDRASALASLRRDFPGTVLTSYPPSEVENLRRIDSLPFVLAGLLGVLAATTIAHALVTSVRRRRRDLAVLKTLGFIRGQVSATVAWQASTLAVVASIIGLAAGIAGGRWLWIVYATRLGVRPEPVIPAIILVAIIPGAVFLSNMIAALPARAAARTAPALILRTE